MNDGSSTVILWEIAVVLCLVLVNGAFSMAEIAMISVRRHRLEQRAREGNPGARAALDITASPERFLSTVQVGMTLIGILTGAFSGTRISGPLADMLERTPLLAPYAEPLAFGLVVIVITYVTLILGELLPKRIALNNAEPLALFFARPMNAISFAATPAVALLSGSTRALLKLLRLDTAMDSSVTEEELRHVIHQAAHAGVLVQAEREILERALHLGDRRVTAFMTPRTDISWLPIGASTDEIRKRIEEGGHSQYLVCEKTVDTVLGLVRVVRLFAQRMKDGKLDLRAAMEAPLFIPERIHALRALDLMKTSGQSLAVVLDEYGGVCGIVTLQDLVSIVFFGARPGEDALDEHAVQREDGSWLVSGLMPVEAFDAQFEIPSPADSPPPKYETVGGLIMERLNRIPRLADRIDHGGWVMEVVDMDGRRVDKVLLTKAEPPPEE